ncbi:unnamed protein product [Caenorhabditis nigoni]
MTTIKQEINDEPDGAEGPERKRARRAEDQGSSSDQDAQTQLYNLRIENETLKSRIQQLEEALRNRPAIDISNKVEEMDHWIKKLEKIHDEDIDLLKKSMSDLAGNLKQEFAEKIDIFSQKFDGKIDNLTQKIDNSSQKIDKMEKSQQKKTDKLAQKVEDNEEDLQKLSRKISKIDKSIKVENEKSVKHMEEKFEKFQKRIFEKIDKSAEKEEDNGQRKLRRGRSRCPPK